MEWELKILACTILCNFSFIRISSIWHSLCKRMNTKVRLKLNFILLKVSRSQSKKVIKWKFGGNMYFISYLTEVLGMTNFLELHPNF